MHTSHSAIFWLKLLIFGVVGLFVLVMALLFLAIFLASLFERQRVCDYISPNGKPMPPESPYLKVMNETARLMGFQPGGVFAHSRNGAMYRLSLTLWLSPDKNSLLAIASGTVAAMPYKRSWLYSKLAPSTTLVTIDGLGSEDLSGTLDQGILLNADLPELSNHHTRRLEESGVAPEPFAPNNLMAEYQKIQQTKAEHLVKLGYAKFIEPTQNNWKYTLKGAWMNLYLVQTRGLQRGQAQSDRMNLSRPGG